MKNVIFVVCSLLTGGTSVLSASSSVEHRAAKDGEWITPARNFLVARLVRTKEAPAKTYDAVVDVPPTQGGKSPQPKVARSCGNAGVDAVAVDYAKLVARQAGPLSEQNKTKELRFPIRLTPVAIAFPLLGPPPVASNKFYTPAPVYPHEARLKYKQGSGIVQITFAYGHAVQVVIAKSTGNPALDANSGLAALSSWTGPKDVPEVATDIPITYRLR